MDIYMWSYGVFTNEDGEQVYQDLDTGELFLLNDLLGGKWEGLSSTETD